KLPELMELSAGAPEIVIGLLDGPVAVKHPDLQDATVRVIPGKLPAKCDGPDNAACGHGTFVAGILSAKRASAAPAICPGCTLLLRPIFGAAVPDSASLPSATPQELAAALVETIDGGARIINISSALLYPSANSEPALQYALDYAMRRGVIVVAAAGNQAAVGSSAITRHPWVIPVVAYDLLGRPLGLSNFGSSIGRRGLGAPGDQVTSLAAAGGASNPSGGTSVAAPFVTGAIALLWSEFPAVPAGQIKFTVTQAHGPRSTVIPPLLDASKAYQAMDALRKRRA